MERNARVYLTSLVRDDLRDRSRAELEALEKDLREWDSDDFTGIVRDAVYRKLEIKKKIKDAFGDSQ